MELLTLKIYSTLAYWKIHQLMEDMYHFLMFD